MQFLKRFFDFYIFGNIHVALGVYCLAQITLLQYSIQGYVSSFFVFFSTIIAYNFIRYYRISTVMNWFSDWLKSNKAGILSLTTVSLIFMAILLFKLKVAAILCLLPFVFCTFFYVVPIPIMKESLRNIPGIKLFLIAISFAGSTVFFPLVQNGISIGYNECIVFIQRFLFVVVITIPFDIRDIHCDDITMKTLPQSIGIKSAKIVGLLFGILFFILELFKETVVDINMYILFTIALGSSIFLFFSKENQSKYYSAFWVESLPIIWWILILVFS